MNTLTLGIGIHAQDDLYLYSCILEHFQGAHYRCQELLAHRGFWIGGTGEGGTGFADVSCGSGLSVF